MRGEVVKFWQAPDLGKLDLLHARYITHSFTRHTHDGYAIGIIEQGAETFFYRGGIHLAPAGSAVIINPGEVHTGHAHDHNGWTYRMLYPEAALVQRAAAEVSAKINLPDFPEPVIFDPQLVSQIRRLHTVLETSHSVLERESALVVTLAHMISRHAAGFFLPPSASEADQAVQRAREYLDAHLAGNISLDELARVANLSSYHLLRVFKNSVGLPPHTYQNQVRVKRARHLLAQGWPIVQVAAETGFVDQSHLSRRFKGIFGITPGQFRNFVQENPPEIE